MPNYNFPLTNLSIQLPVRFVTLVFRTGEIDPRHCARRVYAFGRSASRHIATKNSNKVTRIT